MAQSDVQYEGVEEAISSIKTFISHQCQLLASAGFPGPTLFAWPQVSTLTLDLILHLFTSPQTRFFWELLWPQSSLILTSILPFLPFTHTNPVSRVLAFSFQEEKYGVNFSEGKILMSDYYANLPCYGL